MAKKFNKTAFRRWLDYLCKVTSKTGDNFTCQKCGKNLQCDRYNCQWCHIKSRNRNNLRWDIANNETLCGTCHAWAHANPDVSWEWLYEKYPGRKIYLNDKAKEPLKTWREADYIEIEEYLLSKARDLNVDVYDFPKEFRVRFRRKMKGGEQ